MTIRRKVATMGEKSIIPMRGMNCRMGARIGSVISWMTTTRGFPGSIEIQEKMTRRKIEMSRT
jgi:hypothetical protein